MIDPLSFDGIAGAALGPTFTFLFGCLKDLLKRRKKPADDSAQPEIPAELADRIDPLVPDLTAVEKYADELSYLRGLLSVYDEQSELLTNDDAELVRALALLHTRLREIYHQPLPLRDFGAGQPDVAVIRTEMIDVDGKHVGASIGTFRGSLHVEHKVRGGTAGAETIGAEVRQFGRLDKGPE